MSDTTYTPADLRYAATSRCPCGAGLAYPKDSGLHGSWDCGAILTGTADANVQHTAKLPFAFYEIKSEDQPSANGRTTRPEETEGEEIRRLYLDSVRVATARVEGIERVREQIARDTQTALAAIRVLNGTERRVLLERLQVAAGITTSEYDE
jgi:hypothetical protein